MAQKSSALVFDTNFFATLVEGVVSDGKFLLKTKKSYKEWILSIPVDNVNEKGEKKVIWQDVRPFMVKGRFGNRKPLYLLKWNSLYPIAFESKVENKKFISPDTNESLDMRVETISPIELSFKDTKITPELLGETHDLRFLKGMKKYIGEDDSKTKGIVMFAVIAIALAIIGYIVYYYVTHQ